MRTGDTPQAERAAMLRTPPHILVTTPESLYLLLTAERSREMLRTVADGDRRRDPRRDRHAARRASRAHRSSGCSRWPSAPLLRIGLSATQKPIEEVARFLVGTAAVDASDAPRARSSTKAIGATMDLGVELPGSPLEAVMSHEVWEEYYDRLTELIDAASDDAGVREHAAAWPSAWRGI